MDPSNEYCANKQQGLKPPQGSRYYELCKMLLFLILKNIHTSCYSLSESSSSIDASIYIRADRVSPCCIHKFTVPWYGIATDVPSTRDQPHCFRNCHSTQSQMIFSKFNRAHKNYLPDNLKHFIDLHEFPWRESSQQETPAHVASAHSNILQNYAQMQIKSVRLY